MHFKKTILKSKVQFLDYKLMMKFLDYKFDYKLIFKHISS